MHFCLLFVSYFFVGQSFVVVVLDSFFFFGRQKNWSLVTLDRWSSYTVTNAWEFAWAGSAFVVLDKWSSYRGGCLNRFDCSNLEQTCRDSIAQYLENQYHGLRKNVSSESEFIFGDDYQKE